MLKVRRSNPAHNQERCRPCRGPRGSADPYSSFVCAAFALYSQLEELVPAGLTPDEALRAVTSEVARFLRWGEVLAQGREEREAVLVLLEGNPLKEIRDTRRIVVVVLRGEEVLERLELDRLLEERRD